jgi:hypothetical protein
LYALLALRYPIGPSLALPRAGWADLTPVAWSSVLLHVGIYLGLTLLYVLALRLLVTSRPAGASAGRANLWIVVLTWAACSGILMTVAPAGESHDIFDYLFRGRMMAELGGNPLAELPKEYSRAPFYRYVAWHGHVDTYGPLWEAASAATATGVRAALQALGWWDAGNAASGRSCPEWPAACRSLVGYVTGYRLLAVLLTAASAALIAGMMRRSRPSLRVAAVLAWLWSPVLLISMGIGAHNDALMIVLLLAMLWLFQRERWFLGLLALALAAHVKLTALIVVPVVGLWLVRRCGWRKALILGGATLAAGLALSWALYAPFGGWQTLPRMLEERAAFLANSPWQVLHRLLRDRAGWPDEQARRITVQLPTWLAVFGASLLALWLLDFRPRRWKTDPAPDWSDDRWLWRAVAVVALFYLLAGSFWFQHWYLGWVLAPAALLPRSLLTRVVLPWLGFGALSANVIGAFAPALAPGPLSRAALAALTLAIIWVPVLIAALWVAGSARRRGASPA